MRKNWDQMDFKMYFIFLDEIRESGIVNMFSAPPLLQDIFELDRTESLRVFSLWSKTFDRCKTVDDRAAEAERYHVTVN